MMSTTRRLAPRKFIGELSIDSGQVSIINLFDSQTPTDFIGQDGTYPLYAEIKDGEIRSLLIDLDPELSLDEDF